MPTRDATPRVVDGASVASDLGRPVDGSRLDESLTLRASSHHPRARSRRGDRARRRIETRDLDVVSQSKRAVGLRGRSREKAKIARKSARREKARARRAFSRDASRARDGDARRHAKRAGAIEGNGRLGNARERTDGRADGRRTADMLTRDDSAKARRGDDFGKGATPRCVTGFGASDGSTTTSARSTPSTSPPSVTVGASTSPRRALLAEALRSRARDGADGGTTRDARARRSPSEDSEYSCDENFVLKSAGGGVDVGARARVGSGRDVDADVAVREARDADEGGFACESRAASTPIDIPRGSDGMLHWKTCVQTRERATRADARRARGDARASPPVFGCSDLTTDDLV